MFDVAIEGDVLRARRPGTRWLSSGWDGGFRNADAAYNLTVPEGFDRTDLDTYLRERLTGAGFADPGPALFTGVGLEHARGARCGTVEVVATVGLSNPAALPVPPADGGRRERRAGGDDPAAGTVNLLLGTRRALDDGALAALHGVAVEAKTATLLAETGLPGTTTDAVVAGCDPGGEPAPFAGSATAVGAAARVCVRDAVRASLASRYADGAPPATVEEAEYGVRTVGRADVYRPP